MPSGVEPRVKNGPALVGWFSDRRARQQAELDGMMQQASAKLLTNPNTPVELLAKAVKEYPEDRVYVAAPAVRSRSLPELGRLRR